MLDLKGRRFALVCHEVEGATGFPMAFSEYLKPAGASVVYIKFPFFYSATKSIWIEKFQAEKLVSRRRSWIRFFQPQLLSFLKDFLWLMLVGWRHIRGAEFVLVSDNLLGFAAWILRALGVIPRFTYLVVDYSPRRFANPLVEWLYLKLDRLVATRADSVWTMSLAMLEGRERDGKLRLQDVRYRLAPMGNQADVLFRNGDVSHDMRQLVYLGNPNAKNVRADLLIEMAHVLKQHGELFRLTFVGPGDTTELRRMAKELEVEDVVEFKGSIATSEELDHFLSHLGVGLAPYDPGLKDNFSKYADPAKIKNYLGCGLPVITTTVPQIAQDVVSRGAGLIAEFSAVDFARQVQTLWHGDAYKGYRARAISMGQDFTYSKIFQRLLEEEGLITVRSTTI